MEQIFAWERELGRSRVHGQSRPRSKFQGQPTLYTNLFQKLGEKWEGSTDQAAPATIYHFVILKIHVHLFSPT